MVDGALEALARTDYSAVEGSMISETRSIRFTGNPPFEVCSRSISSLGAMYTQKILSVVT